MEPFVKHRGRMALLDWTDTNTDLIIPARYLKRVERTGYGPLLFADKRYMPGSAPPPDQPEHAGTMDPGFPLNRPEAQGATILVVGHNFGCGSSREHAVWAVAQAGFKVLIAPGKGEGFADIFEGNALNNGLLPIELEPEEWQKLAEAARPGGTEATIDLEQQTIKIHTSGNEQTIAFQVAESARHRLLNGLDPIAETLEHNAAIADHERQAPGWMVPKTA